MSKPAATGEMAGVVKVARAGTTVNMGPPLVCRCLRGTSRSARSHSSMTCM
jgi:hypothetical protein